MICNLHARYLQNTVKDFAARCGGILQESIKWAPNATRSHLIQYLLQMETTSEALHQHTGLALATESVLTYAGYHQTAASLAVCSSWPLVEYHKLYTHKPIIFMLYALILVSYVCSWKVMFYVMMHSTHFIYAYMVSGIW